MLNSYLKELDARMEVVNSCTLKKMCLPGKLGVIGANLITFLPQGFPKWMTVSKERLRGMIIIIRHIEKL